MASTMLTHTRAVLCTNNYVVKSVVAGVTLSNCSAATGSSVENLLVEDPSLTLETTTPVGNPQIIIQFSPAPAGRPMLGLIAHNISQNYQQLTVAQAAVLGGPYTTVGVVDLTLDSRVALSLVNYDVFWELPTTPTAAYLRLTFDSGVASWSPLSIGQILLMDKYEVPVNPLFEEGHVVTRSRPPVALRALGGALHYARGSSKTDVSVSVNFGRIGDGQAARHWNIAEILGQKFIGYIPPGQAQVVNPLGEPHYLLRAVGLVNHGVPGLAAGQHLHDQEILFAGAY